MTIKKQIRQCLLLGAGIVVLGCSVQPIQPQITGGDRDEHDCIPSAGYVWSDLIQDCIRPFELDLQLMRPMTNEGSTYVQQVGVLFSADKLTCEVFVDGKSTILKAVEENRYLYIEKKDNYELHKKSDQWQLMINKTIRFTESR
jgi:hypothetical protein